MPQIQTVGNPGSWVMKLRENCFYSPAASVLSVVLGLIILAVVGYVFDWGIVNAIWDPNPAACREASGACWGFVAEKWRLIIFGRFPYELQWRPGLATLIIVGMLVVSAIPACWTRQGVRMLLWGWVAAFFAFFILMLGGVFNLEPIGTDMWGGLPLTVIITLFGMAASSPLGILLAIGRRSRMPIVSALSTGYIEFVVCRLSRCSLWPLLSFRCFCLNGCSVMPSGALLLALHSSRRHIWQKLCGAVCKPFPRDSMRQPDLWGLPKGSATST